MLEPVTSGVSAAVAAIGAVTVALLGVQYHALVWGLIGTMFAMGFTPPMGRQKAIGFAVLSTLAAAALAHGAADILRTDSHALLIVLSLVGGAGAHKLIMALVQLWVSRISGSESKHELP